MTKARFDEIKSAIRDNMQDEVMLGELLEATETSLVLESRVAALEEIVKKLKP
jgi:hypothetical protein